MITDYSQIQKLFAELDGRISGKIAVYMIGGGALMKREMKDQTKDIDIVVETEREYDTVLNAFAGMGFFSEIPDGSYGRLSIPGILKRGGTRVDLFCREVCGRFSLSENMKERSVRDDVRLKNIDLFVCSPEDIFLFKTMTEREGDYDDCVAIISNKNDFEWSVILNEAQEQSGRGKAVWITWIANRLEEFAERGMNIPVLNDMIRLADEYIAEWERDILSRNPDLK